MCDSFRTLRMHANSSVHTSVHAMSRIVPCVHCTRRRLNEPNRSPKECQLRGWRKRLKRVPRVRQTHTFPVGSFCCFFFPQFPEIFYAHTSTRLEGLAWFAARKIVIGSFTWQTRLVAVHGEYWFLPRRTDKYAGHTSRFEEEQDGA